MATLDQDDLDAIAALFTAGTMVMSVKRFVVANNTSDPAFHVTNSAGHATRFHATGSQGYGLDCTGSTGGSGAIFSAPSAGWAGMEIYGGSDGPGIDIYAGGGSGNGIQVTASAGHGIFVDAGGVGNHDIKLAGSGTVDGTIRLSAAGLDAIIAGLDEAGDPLNARQVLWLLGVTAGFGRVAGAETDTLTFKDADNVATRLTVETDEDGNRTEITTNPPA